MKKNIIVTLFILLSITLNAQQKDPAAVSLLNKVSKAYSAPIQLKFSFNLKNTKENINQSAKGSIYSSGSKYSLVLDNTTQIYDGYKVYTISNEEREVTIVPNPDSEELLTPTKVLNSYKSGYNVKSSGTTKVNGKTAKLVTLTPTENSSNTSKIELAIDDKNSDLLQVKEYTKQGSVTTISIISASKNVIIPGAVFKFNQSYYKNKGFYITTL